MNKTPKINMIGAILLAVLGAAISAGPLRAEDLIGKFTLPIEVRWGQATLPPGDYSFRINPEVVIALSTQVLEDSEQMAGQSVELLQRGPSLPKQEPWASMPNQGSW